MEILPCSLVQFSYCDFFFFFIKSPKRVHFSTHLFCYCQKKAKFMKKLNCQSSISVQLFQLGVLSRNGFHGRNWLLFSAQGTGACFCFELLHSLWAFPRNTCSNAQRWSSTHRTLTLGWIKCQFGSPLIWAEPLLILLPDSQSPSFQDLALGAGR